MCIPNFVTITVQGEGVVPDNDTTTYIWVVSFKLDTSTDKFVYDFNFWIQAILVKLVPCIGLTILSILLIRTMKKAEKRRRNLMMKSLKPGGEEENTSRDRKTNRTTRMLLVIVGLFLLTEAPQVCFFFFCLLHYRPRSREIMHLVASVRPPVCFVCLGLLRAHYTPLQRYMGYL